MNKLYDEWKSKRLFRIENDRFKTKKYIYTSPIRIRCQGFNNKNLYPILFSDALNKYYRMNGYNIMYPIVYDNINQESLLYSKLRGESFDNLKEYYHNELCEMAVGFDPEKEICIQDKNYIVFVQSIFNRLYKDKYIYPKNVECYVDFSNHEIIPFYNVIFENGLPINKENNEKLHIKVLDTMVLDLNKIPNLLDDINNLNIKQELKDELFKIIGCKEGLNIIIRSYEKDMGIEAKIDNPELMGGISFIAINPSLTDIKLYTTQEELDTINDYLINGNESYDCYTGLTLKNPLTNQDIYVFASYKFDEDIHIGIPSFNALDFMFASSVGINSIEIIENDKLINSDFLNGLTLSEAHEAIIKAFIDEDIAYTYLYQKNHELIISSYDELGILLPMAINYKQELSLIDESHYPIYYTNRFKIYITNEETLDSDFNVSKMVFNRGFIKGITNIYAKEYDMFGGNSDYFNNNTNYEGFDNVLGIFSSESALEEILYSVLLNSILASYNKKYSNYSNVIILDNLKEDPLFLEEHQRLGVSFVDEIINRASSDAYRLYLFTFDDYTDDLGDTILEVKKYSELLKEIKNTYYEPFNTGVFENSYFYDFKKNEEMLIKNNELKKYTKNLIEFFNSYIKNKTINKNEAYEFLIMLSIICPNITEEINKEIFKNRYSIFYSEWPK